MKKRIVTLLTTALLLSFAFSSTVSAAGFVQDTSGVKFQNDDGSFAANTWVQAGTGIYHLDAAGFVQTGWIQVGDLWYYLDETGVCTNPEGSPVGPNAEAAPLHLQRLPKQLRPRRPPLPPRRLPHRMPPSPLFLKPRAGRCMRPLMRHCCRMALPPG